MTQAMAHPHANLHALAMIISGTFSTVITKIQYSVRAEGTELCVDPTGQSTTNCPFDKPWFGVLLAKLAMALCLVYLYVRKAVEHKSYLETPLLRLRKSGQQYVNTPTRQKLRNASSRNGGAQETTSLLSGNSSTMDEENPPLSLKTIFAIAFPSLLDLFQTVLGTAGLLWVSSSVYQMARGSVIIFSAVLSVKYMNKRLYAYHYMSILIVGVSVVLVGWAGTSSSASDTDDSTANAILGLSFIIGAQLLMAVQIVVEEHMMVSLNVSPLLLVGWEGLWGLIFFVVLAPVLTLTPGGTSAISKMWHEDFEDSFVKLWNSPIQLLLSVLSVIVVAVLNVTANYVTKHLAAVMRSIIETLRTLGVWIVDLLIVYAFNWRGANSPGEEWTKASWLELLGFVLMVYGTLAYKKLIQIPVEALYAAEKREQAAVYKSPFMSSMHK
ncbi:hypothetical protein Poli38472_000200 [Pythium oligandrum]|uniref:Uncharacterized protein n=1 Tax=Pythium oligandrum TaxID=41045 RepID=A0A8K1CCK5_PYTOL|nr:hypothetical protein Poli38472_000200 [Pythium oligandrum]|eukprot:TMW60158.1 hypothetical protein Poli38472_000200 [Pythium oligandrum]